jgi:hypothetical protein
VNVERTHAKYAASSAYRWFACPGSVKLIAKTPKRPSSPWAQDGTDAHALLEFALRERYRTAQEAAIMYETLYEAPTYRADSEKERVDSVQTALDYVYDILDSYGDDAELILEHQAVFPTNDECGGTNDVIIIIKPLDLMYVIDFKHGAGYGVTVEENKQMMIYGVMAYDGINGANTTILTIIQPRAFHRGGHIREWIVPPGRLEAFIPEVGYAIMACEAEDAPLVPGEIQCRWCEANTSCPALEKQALSAVSTNFANVKDVTAILPTIAELPVDRLAYILQTQKLMENWYKECYLHALELAKAGYVIPGYKLVEADAKRRWPETQDEQKAVASQIMSLAGVQIDAIMPRELVGVLTAEKLLVDAYKARAEKGSKLIAAREAKQVFAAFTIKDTSGTISLVPVGDRRQAVTVKSQFGTVALPPPEKKQE